MAAWKEKAKALTAKNMLPRLCGLALFAILALPPVFHWLEKSMVGQMLGLTPLLVLSGALIFWPANMRREREKPSRIWGLPGFLFGMFIIAYWMLPRSLDMAVADKTADFIRFVTLPLLAGVPFVKSWSRLSLVAKGFVWANLVSMFIVMGWLYLASPNRLCNYYLLGQQQLLGRCWLVAAIAVSAYKAAGTLFGTAPANETPENSLS
ncbi:MAG TPA: hypothetical protein VF260_08965 [Bacilli bacterium]